MKMTRPRQKKNENSTDLPTDLPNPPSTTAPAKSSIPLYVPNILCYIRIILSLVSINTASHVNNSDNKDALFFIYLTISIWSIASILDHIDGKIARSWNQCSELGVLLDIVADNILRSSTWICVIMASTSLKTIAATACKTTNTSAHSSYQCNELGTDMTIIHTLAPILGVFFISMEWFTMISSQMLKVMKDKRHWKNVGHQEYSGNDGNDGNDFTKQSHKNYVGNKTVMIEHDDIEMYNGDRDNNDELEKIHLISHDVENHELIYENKNTSMPNTAITTVTSPINKTNASPQPSLPPPKFVQAVFANNFCNFFGILAMYGLFSIGMMTFLYIHKCILVQSMPPVRFPLYVAFIIAYIGRFIALCTEIWLCCEYMKFVISLDIRNMNKKDQV